MNFKKLLTYQANKFSKTTITVRFNLLQVCPLVPSFVFAVSFILSVNVLSCNFHV